MRIPVLSAVNDLIESYAFERKTQMQISRLAEASWSKYVDEEPDISRWQAVYRAATNFNPSDKTLDINTPEYLSELRQVARWLARHDGTGAAAMRAYKIQVWGVGPAITPNDDNPQHGEYWTQFVKENNFNKLGAQVVEQLFRDGEVFLCDRGKQATGKKRFVLLPPEDIQQPQSQSAPHYSHGIQTDPQDVTSVIAYWYKGTAYDAEKQIHHIKINCDENEKRGRTIFEPVNGDILDYRAWRRNRAKLNWVRTLVGIVKVITGSPQRVSEMTSAAKGNRDTGTDSENRDYVRAPKAGTTFVTNQPDGIKMLSPNLQAADAQHDGRMILLSAASGLGLSEVWLTADSQNANFASQQVAESPAVQNMEFWREFVAEQFIQWLYGRIIQEAIEGGEIDDTYPQTYFEDGLAKEEVRPADITCRVEWPVLIHREPDKEATASATRLTSGVSDPRTEAAKQGIDYDQVLENRKRDNTDATGIPDIQGGADKDQDNREVRRLEQMASIARETKRLAEYVRKAVE